MRDQAKLSNLINRLELHMKDSKVNLLIKEAMDTILDQEKRISDLESMLDMIDGALCNYINDSDDPYEPASRWDDANRNNFERLCDVYSRWHRDNGEVGRISMDRYVEEQDTMRDMMVRSLKDALYRAKPSHEAREIIERIIRRYEDHGIGVV